MDNASVTTELQYVEGSEACRNYSRITLDAKTTFLKAVAGLVVMVIAYVFIRAQRAQPPADVLMILYLPGIALIFLSVVMALVVWHYQSAFESIRNRLADLEDSGGVWSCHARARSFRSDYASTYAMFLGSAFAGYFCSALSVTDADGLSTKITMRIVLAGTMTIAAWVFVKLYRSSMARRYVCSRLHVPSRFEERTMALPRSRIRLIAIIIGLVSMVPTLA